MKEVLPKINELNMIVKIIKSMNNLTGFENIKNLFEIVYNTYIKFSNNYYHSININHILTIFIENNQDLKNNIPKDEYENISKIKIVNKKFIGEIQKK